MIFYLFQIYQISYIIIKFGISSRPGNWILERSTDGGVQYKPWQYFAINSEECVQTYNVQPTFHREKMLQIHPNITCITSFSRYKPHENGEVKYNKTHYDNFYNNHFLFNRFI